MVTRGHPEEATDVGPLEGIYCVQRPGPNNGIYDSFELDPDGIGHVSTCILLDGAVIALGAHIGSLDSAICGLQTLG